MFDPVLKERISQSGVIAVLVLDRLEDAIPVAKSLLEGGITVMELTLRTEVAFPALEAIVRDVPEMLVGIGTILTPVQAHEAVDRGAAFGVAPGCNPRVINAARDVGLPFAPGVATPSDIEAAVEAGCRLLKFFPAEAMGGMQFLQAIAAPYAHLGLRYIPLGGLYGGNLDDYASNPLVAALGGSWIATRERIREGKWAEITALARKAQTAIQHAARKPMRT